MENIADRAAGYGIPGEVVDGNDVCAVYEAFARAKERALKGEGPTLLECKTYRWRGHWTGDPEPYRTREEVEEWKEKRDPIKLFRSIYKRPGYFLHNFVCRDSCGFVLVWLATGCQLLGCRNFRFSPGQILDLFKRSYWGCTDVDSIFFKSHCFVF